jgi:hypothetical protein
MRYVSLSANVLSNWLSTRGLECKEALWANVESNCSEDATVDYQFVVNEVPWRGALLICVSFARSVTLWDAGEPMEKTLSRVCRDEEIMVINVVMTAIVSCSRRLHRPANWVAPHFGQQELDLELEYPTLQDLEKGWHVLSRVAKEVQACVDVMSSDFEQLVAGDFVSAGGS